MQEILLEDQLRTQLLIQDPVAVLTQQAQQQQNRQNRPRRVKKQVQPKAPEATIEETINSLKNEIEYMPMKTPISILQELLSRRGNLPFWKAKKLLIFNLIPSPSPSARHHAELRAGADRGSGPRAFLPLPCLLQRQRR